MQRAQVLIEVVANDMTHGTTLRLRRGETRAGFVARVTSVLRRLMRQCEQAARAREQAGYGRDEQTGLWREPGPGSAP